MFIANETGILTKKIDIFSLGILLHQYFCGEIPEFDKEKYDYLFEAVLDDGEIKISDKIPDYFKSTLLNMLSKHPARRPQASEILQVLQQTTNKEERAPTIYDMPATITASGLKNTMRKTNDVNVISEHSQDSFFKKADDLL